jgi:hypothetical protein
MFTSIAYSNDLNLKKSKRMENKMENTWKIKKQNFKISIALSLEIQGRSIPIFIVRVWSTALKA